MAEGMSFSFPSLLFHEGRTYGQPEAVGMEVAGNKLVARVTVKAARSGSFRVGAWVLED